MKAYCSVFITALHESATLLVPEFTGGLRSTARLNKVKKISLYLLWRKCTLLDSVCTCKNATDQHGFAGSRQMAEKVLSLARAIVPDDTVRNVK